MYRGVLTGFNEAFIVDLATRNRLVEQDSKSAEIIKYLVNGEDVRPWFVEDEARYLIFTRRGIDIDAYPAVKQHLEQFRERLEPKPKGWSGDRWPGRKAGSYEWYEIQDTVDYHRKFDESKILWPEMAKQPRFALAEAGVFGNKTTFMIPGNPPFVLGVLMARTTWFAETKLNAPIGERAGMLRYTQSAQFMSRLPIPDASADEREAIGALTMKITEQARDRYTLHERARNRIFSDLGKPEKKLNQKLTAWWNLDFSEFRAQMKKVFKQDIPLSERDEWADWLEAQRDKHERYTVEIVCLETELNERVYALFNLTPEEIQIIEESTKYKYGEV